MQCLGYEFLIECRLGAYTLNLAFISLSYGDAPARLPWPPRGYVGTDSPDDDGCRVEPPAAASP